MLFTIEKPKTRVVSRSLTTENGWIIYVSIDGSITQLSNTVDMTGLDWTVCLPKSDVLHSFVSGDMPPCVFADWLDENAADAVSSVPNQSTSPQETVAAFARQLRVAVTREKTITAH